MNAQTKQCMFYDGQCAICRAEVDKLKRLSDAQISFEDIHSPNNPLPLPKATLLSALHVQQENGEWLVGLDANLAAWQHTKYHRLADFLRLPFIHPIARLGYAAWLWFYRRFLQQRARL